MSIKYAGSKIVQKADRTRTLRGMHNYLLYFIDEKPEVQICLRSHRQQVVEQESNSGKPARFVLLAAELREGYPL